MADHKNESFGERLKRLREAEGVTRQQLASEIGVSRAAIALLENGQSKSMDPGNLLKTADALGVDPYELQFGAARVQQLMEETVPYGGKQAAMRRRRQHARIKDVPIVGYVIASPGEDGYFDDMGFPPGGGDGVIPWPTRDPNSYALRVKGDSMQPRIRPGELIVVQPSVQVLPGHDVVVRTKDGRKMVKQLLFERAGEVALGSINQAHRQLTISVEEIESMHYVSAIVPRGPTVRED